MSNESKQSPSPEGEYVREYTNVWTADMQPAVEIPPITPAATSSAVAPEAPEPVEIDPLDRALFSVDVPYTISKQTGEGVTSVDLPIPAARSGAALRAMADLSGAINPNTPEMQKYLATYSVSQQMTPFDGGLEQTVSRADASFTNDLRHGPASLRGGFPAIAESSKNTPEARQAMIRNGLGMGNHAAIPLHHSGFWITLKAPSEGALLELNRTLADARVGVGRRTYGLMYSADTALTAMELCKFAIENIFDTNVKNSADQNFFELISILDLPLLINGLASSIWPGGYRMRRTCVADAEKCRHEIVERVSIPRLVFDDANRFSDDQLRQLAERPRNSVTVERIRQYQAGNHLPKISNVLINKVVFNFKVPTLQEYFTSALRWAADIENKYGSALSYDENLREKTISQHRAATLLRNWSHVVSSIQIEDNVFNEQEDIEAALADMSASENHVASFTAAVREFLDNATSAVVGVPTYTCPACGKPQPVSNPNSNYPELIPLDPMQVFFSLLHQKLTRYLEA